MRIEERKLLLSVHLGHVKRAESGKLYQGATTRNGSGIRGQNRIPCQRVFNLLADKKLVVELEDGSTATTDLGSQVVATRPDYTVTRITS
jgi:hypothetical protein